MAASIVQQNRGTSTTTSVSATYGSATTTGNTLIAAVYANIATGLETISGWTLLNDAPFSAGAQSIAVWAKIADGTETTVTSSGAIGASQMRIHIFEISGLTASITTDGTGQATSGVSSVTSLLSGSIATTNANDYIFVATAVGGSTTAHSYDSSFTLEQTDASAIRLFTGDISVSVTGTYSTTGSWTTAVRAGSAAVAFKLATTSVATGQGTTANSIHPGLGTNNIGRFFQSSRDADIHTVPNAPTSLLLTADNEYRVVLNWTGNGPVGSNAAQYFRIERSLTAGSGYSEIGTTVSAYYIDLTASSNTVYYYRVRAHNYYGDSSYLTEQFVTTLSPYSPWTALIQGWVYIGNPYKPKADYTDGRVLGVIKPEYATVSSGGVISEEDDPAIGADAYNPTNAASMKSYSNRQFYTVSASYTGFHALMGSPTNQTNGITVLVNLCATAGFTGVELDFEGFGSWTDADYDAYKTFLINLGSSLHSSGFKLMICGPPIGLTTNYSDLTQNFYKFKYEDITPLVDYVVVLAYDYEYDYSAGSPVQPIQWLKDIIDWTILKVGWTNRSKIIIGMPAYGYHGPTSSYTITIDAYKDSVGYTGFGTATRDASSGELMWANAGTSYVYQDSASLNLKRQIIEDKGITNVSVWFMGGNLWFNGRAEPISDTRHLGAQIQNGLHPGSGTSNIGRFYQSQRDTNISIASNTISISEPATISESLSSYSDQIDIMELVNIALVDTIGISDSLTFSESLKLLIISSVNLTDTTTTSESIQSLITSSVIVSDTITTSESRSINESISIIQQDTITTTDTPQTQELSFINVSDNFTLSENIVFSGTLISVTDSSTLSESLNHYSDQIDVMEFIAVTIITDRAVNTSDTTTLTENISTTIPTNINVIDFLTSTERVDVIRASTRDIAIVDNRITDESGNFLLDESGNFITDNSPSDLIISSESVNATKVYNISASGAITLSESVTVIYTLAGIVMNDSMTMSEQLTMLITSRIAVSDTLATSDNTSIFATSNLPISDSISMNENLSLLIPTLFIRVNDTLTYTESPIVNIVVAGTDSIVSSDSVVISEMVVLTVSAVLLNMNDHMNTTEITQISTQTGITISDAMSVSEQILLQPVVSIVINDSMLVSENVSIYVGINISTTDSISTVDQAFLGSGINTLLSDAYILNEQISLTITTLFIATSDSLTINEHISITQRNFIPRLTLLGVG